MHENLIVYQIYPKSFCDSNGDGIGDLRGIIMKLDYLSNLGVNMIWLNPIFVSPQVDNGYDISDYYHIDSIFGNQKDLEDLLNEAHKRNIKVIFDLVLNHTSDKHPWFLEAKKSKDNPYRHYYIWADKDEESGNEPNNWASFFGGSVWEWESNQYYFHLFAKEMPDLNWENPKVRQEMVNIAKYWLAKGIDGFRVDAFIHIAKEKDFPNMPDDTHNTFVLAEQYYANLPKVNEWMHEFVEQIKEEYPNTYFVGEASSADALLGHAYTNEKTGFFHSAITFRYFAEDDSVKDNTLPMQYQRGALDFDYLKQAMTEWQQYTFPVLYLNNHDMPRIVTRLAQEGEYRTRVAKLMATLMYLQRGIPYLYYGEEIGMRNVQWQHFSDYTENSAQQFIQKAQHKHYDKQRILSSLSYGTRDTARGMMQWEATPRHSWIVSHAEADYNVEQECIDSTSVLHYYKQLLRLKQTSLFTKGEWALMPTHDGLYVYERYLNDEHALVICNVTSTKQAFESEYVDVILSTLDRITYDGVLAPYEAIVLRRK
ncbi:MULTISPECIES: alpha-glucosidase [unclassified Granulicatella]|uniref:glycoside hydrolase family 13 protein n=1 Tax=unclassified Granulicatella TaxID=2630493 RepID=UPI0010741E69|nr:MULTISPECIES: alpha-glucosidase [unclassified Granulicatella]MBF0779653.1 alpha-glucosidase [Granulicatella sp. 19428wC4_WM01]TFU96309.1 alpha-glucosidase [Granulicatella sp. WM01]